MGGQRIGWDPPSTRPQPVGKIVEAGPRVNAIFPLSAERATAADSPLTLLILALSVKEIHLFAGAPLLSLARIVIAACRAFVA